MVQLMPSQNRMAYTLAHLGYNGPLEQARAAANAQQQIKRPPQFAGPVQRGPSMSMQPMPGMQQMYGNPNLTASQQEELAARQAQQLEQQFYNQARPPVFGQQTFPPQQQSFAPQVVQGMYPAQGGGPSQGPQGGMDLASNYQQQQAGAVGKSLASRSSRGQPFANLTQFGQRQGRGGRQPVFSPQDAVNRQNASQIQQKKVQQATQPFARKPMFAPTRST